MAKFDLYAPILMKWEAGIPAGWQAMSMERVFDYAKTKGWVNDPLDKGGATMVGVTLATFRTYYGGARTVTDLKNITYRQWYTIMKHYWDKCKGDQIVNQSVANFFVDWYVNAGIYGIKNAQKAIGTTPDGIVGPKTLAALNTNPMESFLLLQDARRRYYSNIVIANPSQAKFIKGWLNRVDGFMYAEN